MRKIILIILGLTLSQFIQAQIKRPWNYRILDEKTIHFGFSLGLNSMDYSAKRTLNPYISSTDTIVLIPDVSGIMPPGFQVQIISDLRLGEDLNLRFLPGICFGQRALSFYEARIENNVLHRLSDPSYDIIADINSAYLDFPLSLKYRAARLNNYRPYIIGGVNYRYDLSSRNDEEVLIQTKPGDFYVETGMGVDWYLPYFKFSTEIKIGIGLRDILVRHTNYRPEYLYSLDRLRSYIFCLSFHFE